MSDLDVQLLHFTCCSAIRCFADVANDGGEETRQWHLLSLRSSPTETLVKDAFEEVHASFVRKVSGLVAAQLLLTCTTAALCGCLEPTGLLSWAHPWAAFMTAGVIFGTTLSPQLSWRHPEAIFGLFGFGLLQAALISPMILACSPAQLLVATLTVAVTFVVLHVKATVMQPVAAAIKPHLFNGMLTLYPWGLLLFLLTVLDTPVSVYAKGLYDVLGALAMGAYLLVDLHRVLGNTPSGRCFNVDSAILNAMSLHHGTLHLFLKCLCLIQPAFASPGSRLAL